MSWLTVLKLLVTVTKLVEQFILEAAERKKAGNLLEIQAAVSDLKTAKTEEEKDDAVSKIEAAFRSR